MIDWTNIGQNVRKVFHISQGANNFDLVHTVGTRYFIIMCALNFVPVGHTSITVRSAKIEVKREKKCFLESNCLLSMSCHPSVLYYLSRCNVSSNAQRIRLRIAKKNKHAALHTAKWNQMQYNILVFLRYCI